MANLIPPHGGKGLTCCLLEGAELEAEKKKAEGLKKILVSPYKGRPDYDGNRRIQPSHRIYDKS